MIFYPRGCWMSCEVFGEFLIDVASRPRTLILRLLRLPPQKEVEVAAHHEVRSERDLMRFLSSFSQELVQHTERHLSLCAWALINRGNNRSGTYFRNETGEKIRRDDGQTVDQVRVPGGLQHRDRCFCRYIDSSQIR